MRFLKRTSLFSLVLILILSGISCTSNSDNGKTTSQDKQTSTAGTVKVGDTAPDFEMRNQEQLNVSLSEFKGKKNVVVVFYPADFTPV